MKLKSFQGIPRHLGLEYGRVFAREIQRNLKTLVWREGYEPMPRKEPEFIAWMKKQEEILKNNWPWLIEEMEGVAQGTGRDYENILLLNLRAWQYNFYGAPPNQACSNIAITLRDGTVACAGALDDVPEYYCGPVRFIPENGYRFIGFPVTGTSWVTRGINNGGLAIGIASQILPGLKGQANSINQDLAIRIILQTCTTVDEVREFCQKHPFTLNLICTDDRGKVFCAHQTSAGLLEVATKTPCALTNHIVDDRIMYWLNKHGVTTFPEEPTTRLRRGKILNFAYEQNGKFTGEDVRRLLADREAGALTSICPPRNVLLTYLYQSTGRTRKTLDCPATDKW